MGIPASVRLVESFLTSKLIPLGTIGKSSKAFIALRIAVLLVVISPEEALIVTSLVTKAFNLLAYSSWVDKLLLAIKPEISLVIVPFLITKETGVPCAVSSLLLFLTSKLIPLEVVGKSSKAFIALRIAFLLALTSPEEAIIVTSLVDKMFNLLK